MIKITLIGAQSMIIIVGSPGDTCLMRPENIDFSNTANRHGTASAKNGTVTVTVNDQDENSGGSSGSAGGGASPREARAKPDKQTKTKATIPLHAAHFTVTCAFASSSHR